MFSDGFYGTTNEKIVPDHIKVDSDFVKIIGKKDIHLKTPYMRLLLSLFLMTVSLMVCSQEKPVPNQEYYMLVGTYDSPKSEGVYVFRFNSIDGTAKEISHFKSPNPSFLAVSPDERFVYAVHEVAPSNGVGGEIAAFTFNKQNGTLTLLNKQLSGGDHPCHVEVDKTGKWIFVSNYSSGTLSVLPVNPDGSLRQATSIQHQGSSKHPQRQKSPHVHGAIISPNNKQLFVTDLGIDKVMIYTFDDASGKLTSGPQPYSQSQPGSGPRMFSFHPKHKFAYVIEELTGTVSVYRYKNEKLKSIQRISTLKTGDTSFAGSAFVEASPDGKFLYASNRATVNSIAIYSINQANGKLKLIGHEDKMVKTPRNFSIDPTGKFLLCENQGSDEIVIFKRDEKTGLLSDTGKRISVGKPVCIKWVKVEQ